MNPVELAAWLYVAGTLFSLGIFGLVLATVAYLWWSQ